MIDSGGREWRGIYPKTEKEERKSENDGVVYGN